MGGVTTWTTKVDPGLVQAAGSQVGRAAAPVNQVVDQLNAVSVTQEGFQTAADLTQLCTGWGASFAKLGAALTGIGAQIKGCGVVYEEHESMAGHMFEAQ